MGEPADSGPVTLTLLPERSREQTSISSSQASQVSAPTAILRIQTQQKALWVHMQLGEEALGHSEKEELKPCQPQNKPRKQEHLRHSSEQRCLRCVNMQSIRYYSRAVVASTFLMSINLTNMFPSTANVTQTRICHEQIYKMRHKKKKKSCTKILATEAKVLSNSKQWFLQNDVAEASTQSV